MKSNGSSYKGKDRDYSESSASLSLSDCHDPDPDPYAPRGDYSAPSYTEPHSYAGNDQYSWSAQPPAYPPAHSSSTYSGTPRYEDSYQTTPAASSTGGYGYQLAPASTSSYDSYAYDDAASVTSSSVPSTSMWSRAPSVTSAATSAPSMGTHITDVNNTIHGQVPPNERYQLPCEFRNLTNCTRVFHGDEVNDWIDHHIEDHLRRKLPSRLRCWFCSDYSFDAKERFHGDARSAFLARMHHIRGHIVDEGYRAEQMHQDGHLVRHLLDRGLIDGSTYDSIVNPTSLPGLPGGHGGHGGHSRHGGHRSHRSSHRLPQVVEEVVASSSSSSRRHRPERREHEHSSRSHGNRPRR
ncbi:hypothetical protein diail_2939 [Diaporthe ilicicola]|nr:hypothetical protein diail_2939 [Diaporthe ilicicola]